LAFAVPTIIGELKHYMRDTAWAVHVPRALQERALTAERAERALAARSPAPPTVRELATEAGMSEEEVLEAFALRLTRDAVPLDTVTPADPSPAGPRFSGAAPDPELENAEDRLSLWDALRALPQRERTILELRFVEDLTQTEIAERVGLSQIYVSRLLRAALETLRSNLD
jgi:RNA polymerase sigma-B factor